MHSKSAIKKYDIIAKPQYYTNYKNITYLKEIYSYFIFIFCGLYKGCVSTSGYILVGSNNALGSMWKAFILA